MINSSEVRVLADAKKLTANIHRLTATLPDSERCGLTSQMRRAAVSIGSTIAEGCGRHGDRSLTFFLDVAKGSASELAFQLDVCVELGFIGDDAAAVIRDEIETVARRLNRFTSVVRARSKLPSPR